MLNEVCCMLISIEAYKLIIVKRLMTDLQDLQ